MRKGLWIAAAVVAVAFPAHADKPAGKGASQGAAEAKGKKPEGKAQAAGKRSGRESGQAKAAGQAGKAAEKGGAGKGTQGKGTQGARKEPGRPASSDDVPGKGKGLDKERPGDDEGSVEADEAKESPEAKRERRQRKKERVEKLKKKWGRALAHPSVAASLKVHARRMARLERVRELASEAGKDEVVERVDELIQKEDERHERHMKVLADRGPGKQGKALGKKPGDEGAPGREEERGRSMGAGKPPGNPGAPGRGNEANPAKGPADKEMNR